MFNDIFNYRNYLIMLPKTTSNRIIYTLNWVNFSISKSLFQISIIILSMMLIMISEWILICQMIIKPINNKNKWKIISNLWVYEIYKVEAINSTILLSHCFLININ